MLLKPTLNRILNATPYIGQPFSIVDREKVGIKFYQQEVFISKQDKIYIIPGSQKMIYGVKNYSKTGITSIDNQHFNIEYNTLKGSLDTGIVYLNQFIFS